MRKILTIVLALLFSLTAVSAYHFDNRVTYTTVEPSLGYFGPILNSNDQALNNLAIRYGEGVVIRSYGRNAYPKAVNYNIYHYNDYPSNRYYGYGRNDYRYSGPAMGYGYSRRMP